MKRALFLLLIIIMLMPASQGYYHFFSDTSLSGYEVIHTKPNLKYFTWHRWFDEEFQREFTAQVTDHTGFRNAMVVARNQVDYSLFRISNAPGFIVGKKNVLFEEDYIHEYTGAYFIGQEVWDFKLNRLKTVYDSLKANGTTLVIVIEPGKATICPEYIPDRYHPQRRTLSNYGYFIRRSTELGIPFLDLNGCFAAMKDTASFPLFPQNGMHWSLYGAGLILDTLSSYISHSTGKQLPSLRWVRTDISESARSTDIDIEEMLNLIFPLKSWKGGYPVFICDTSKIPRSLSALVIADSYYINLVNDFGNKVFRNQVYWYYNSKVYPHHNDRPPVVPNKSNLRNTLLLHDLILLMVSEINFHNGFWNFPDEAWVAFNPGKEDLRVWRIENSMRNDRSWFRFLVKMAIIEQKPLWEKIHGDAVWVFNTQFDSYTDKNRNDSIERIVYQILGNPEWLDLVKTKARESNRALETVLWSEARFSYDNYVRK